MRLQKIEIELQQWGEDKGKYKGKISFIDGTSDSFTFGMSPDVCVRYLTPIANEVIIVKVTKDVLERSKMCSFPDTENCAIAVAFRDLLPRACVTSTFVRLFGYGDDQDITSPLPRVAKEFIMKFDSLNPEQRVLMSPFSFEIEVPEYVIEKIGLSQIYKVLSESSLEP